VVVAAAAPLAVAVASQLPLREPQPARSEQEKQAVPFSSEPPLQLSGAGDYKCSYRKVGDISDTHEMNRRGEPFTFTLRLVVSNLRHRCDQTPEFVFAHDLNMASPWHEDGPLSSSFGTLDCSTVFLHACELGLEGAIVTARLRAIGAPGAGQERRAVP
jgi:hypothetical protein